MAEQPAADLQEHRFFRDHTEFVGACSSRNTDNAHTLLCVTFEYAIQRDSFRRVERSEDRAFAKPVGDGLVVAVADGAGGTPGGAAAADYAIARLERALAEPHFDAFRLRGWVAFLRSLDQELSARGFGGETTSRAIAAAAEDYPADIHRAAAAALDCARLPTGELQDDAALVLVRPQ